MFLEKNIPIEGGSGFPVGCACPKQVITKWAIVCHERSHAEGENYNEDNAKYWVKTFEAIESPPENRPLGFKNVFPMIEDAYRRPPRGVEPRTLLAAYGGQRVLYSVRPQGQTTESAGLGTLIFCLNLRPVCAAACLATRGRAECCP